MCVFELDGGDMLEDAGLSSSMLEPSNDNLDLDAKVTLPKLRFKAHEGTAYHRVSCHILESDAVVNP